MIRSTLSAVKYKLAAALPQRVYWNLMGRFQAVSAVTSEHETLEASLRSGAKVVELFDALDLLSPEAVTLQIGCGIGRIERHLCKRVKYCYGLDVSPAMVTKARANVPDKNVEFICNDGRGLSQAPDEGLDLVYSIYVFQHVPRDVVADYIRAAFAKLKSQGAVAFQMMCDEAGGHPDPPASHPYGLRYYSRAAVIRQLRDAGFRDVWSGPFALGGPDDVLFIGRKP